MGLIEVVVCDCYVGNKDNQTHEYENMKIFYEKVCDRVYHFFRVDDGRILYLDF